MKPQTLFLIGLGLVISVFTLWATTDHPAPAPSTAQTMVESPRDPSGFSGVASRISGKVLITQGATFSVKVNGPESATQKLRTEVKGNRLEIYMESHDRAESDLTVHVTMPAIEEVSLAGSGDIVADNDWTIKNLEISLAGSGDMVFRKLTGDKVEVSIAGSGDVIALGGALQHAEFSVAGSGNVGMETLNAAHVSASIAGSGDMILTASQSLEANIAGSGSIRYHGNPTVSRHVMGSGELLALKD